METTHAGYRWDPWNKGKIVRQKAPFKLKEIGAIRVHLQMQQRLRELALFNLGIDSKLRACDLVSLRVRDVCHGDRVAPRAVVMQHKTQHPVQFEITSSTREAVDAWVKHAGLTASEPHSQIAPSRHAPVRENRAQVGWRGRARPDGVRDAFHAANQTDADLSSHEEPAGRTAFAWSHQDGALSAISASRSTTRSSWRSRLKSKLLRPLWVS